MRSLDKLPEQFTLSREEYERDKRLRRNKSAGAGAMLALRCGFSPRPESDAPDMMAAAELPASFVILPNRRRNLGMQSVILTIHHPDPDPELGKVPVTGLGTLGGNIKDGLWQPDMDTRLTIATHPAFEGLDHREGYFVADPEVAGPKEAEDSIIPSLEITNKQIAEFLVERARQLAGVH